MTLNKQMILSELGSVMNKLKSADCGCMGKMFSNQGGSAMSTPQTTYTGFGQGCCHNHGCGGHSNGYSGHRHGYNACAGEPNTMNSPCMGMQCNPPKLYADTYSYLNQNLMQPVINEVYQDLKSINPANSVVNNPLASQMGLQQQNSGAAMSGDMGNAQRQMLGGNTAGMQGKNMAMNQPMGQMNNQQMNNQQMTHMMGMGPKIVNMMNGDSKNPMASQQGQAPLDANGVQYNTNMKTSNYTGQQVQGHYMQQPYMGNAINPNSPSKMSSYNQQNPGLPNPSYQMNGSNLAMGTPGQAQNYGKHTQGITKFNEMFPGVAQGDLGFDPMSIAIQMNPANQQQVAMLQMQKMMDGNKLERVFDPSPSSGAMQPAITGAYAAASMINQPPTRQDNTPSYQQQAMTVQQGIEQNRQPDHMNVAANQPNQAQQGYIPQQQQQVYTTLATEAMMNTNQAPQQYQQGQLNTDLNTQAMKPPNLPILYEDVPSEHNGAMNEQPPTTIPQHSSLGQPPQMTREQIFPVDTSKNQPPQMRYQKQYEYNTLGQPVEMLPARMYHQPPDTNFQQTLSPQPIKKLRNDLSRFDVKPTVSKTSLMGTRPVGRTPSRNQLQQIYTQYKGSQSHTHQSIPSPVRGTTYSEGKLNIAPAATNQHREMRVERVVGDTLTNAQAANYPISIKGQPMGDVPANNKPHGDIAPAKNSPVKKCRNGLQDMVYTSYPTSAAWSFHGNRGPYLPVHRFRNRI